MKFESLADLYESVKKCNEFDTVILTKCPEDIYDDAVSHTTSTWYDGVAVNNMFDPYHQQQLQFRTGDDMVIAYNEQFDAIYVISRYPHWYFISGLHISPSYNSRLYMIFMNIIKNYNSSLQK